MNRNHFAAWLLLMAAPVIGYCIARLRIHPTTNTWRAWIGFNFSHGLGAIGRFGYDAQEGMVIVRYDAAVSRSGGTAVTTRRFEAKESADGTAATVAQAINTAANRVAMDVAQWVGEQ